jgi:hypothetical protein
MVGVLQDKLSRILTLTLDLKLNTRRLCKQSKEEYQAPYKVNGKQLSLLSQ